MHVQPDLVTLVYQGMHISFCSDQCFERFNTNPHLYVGVPGQHAPKQQGTRIIKHRCFRLESPLPNEQAQVLSDAINAMMGIEKIAIEGRIVRVTYDLLEATAEQIEKSIIEVGVLLGGKWTDKLIRAVTHYAEDCESANLEVIEKRYPHLH